MPMTIHTSNKMEILLDHLAKVVNEPVRPVLSAETIVVQSRGMERWISMELANKFGVWGNCDFPFPNTFVWNLFTSTMPDLHESDSFETEVLTWRVIDQLERLLARSEFSQLQLYLDGHSRNLKLYQLAGKIADTFNQYTLYRGDLLERWETGSDADWQAILWKALAEEGRGMHRARVKSEFLTRLAHGRIDLSLLPPRVLVFGLSYMPSFHMELLAGIAAFVEVHLFALSPCREYWGDILAERSRSRVGTALGAVTDEGNGLLASLGAMGKNFSNLLLDSGSLFSAELDEYAESSGDSLLSSLQNSILNLVNVDPDHRTEIAPDDRSIDVHSCHSPMREVEVLHDQLLDMFSTIDGLAPRDVIVMTPDIETYASYISAVFSGHQDPKCRIPFTIADRTVRNEGRIGEALLAILALPGGRFTAPEVVDILESGPVSARFGMSPDDMHLVKKWLDETHIAWGMSEKDRAALGLPAYAEGSWLAGLERLVMGYALSSDGHTLFDGVLPYDNLEGDAATVLGRFVGFVQSLHAVALDLGRPRSLAQWREALREILLNFFDGSDRYSREFISVGGVIDSLENIEELSGYSREAGLDVMRVWLQRRLDDEGAGVGFLSGKVTFCAMLPMRSVPAKVVALLGMNDGSFPRQSRSPGFDLIPANPRPGDRSLRDEDRYLFLEAILSARERLYISYVGLSIRDNSVMPPSVLVSELLDSLDRGYRRGDGAFHQSLLTLHRLQPFSAAYFTGAKGLFSYSTENLAAAEVLLHAATQRPRFFTGPLSPPDESFRDIRIADLLKFFENPAAYIVRRRLGIMPEDGASPLEEREIFALDNLDAYMIKQEMLTCAIQGRDANGLLAVIRASGALPPAKQGDALFDKLAQEAAAVAEQVIRSIDGEPFLPPLDVDLAIGDFRVHGRIGTILPGKLLRYRSAKLSAKDQVKLWIEHLILNGSAEENYPTRSTLIMRDGSVSLLPVTDATAQLEVLLNRYWQGLIMPLRFFPRSSLEYAKKGKIEAAEAVWNNRIYPESDDPGYRLCFGDESPLDETFEEVALDLFGRYLGSMEEGE